MIHALHGSFLRIWAIGGITLTEALRQRVLYVLFVFGLVLVGGGNFISQISIIDEFKFLKDLGYAAISITGFLIALLGAAQMIPAEIERRTLYTTLSKPVFRFEFILGKYLGLVSLITMMMLIMSVAFAGMLFLKEQEKRVELEQRVTSGKPLEELTPAARTYLEKEQAKILKLSRDPGLFQAGLLVWVKLCVVAAITVFFSTFATSTIFIVAMTCMVYAIGNLQGVAREVWMYSENTELWQQGLLATVSMMVPDFRSFDVIDEIIAGNPVLWSDTLNVFSYVFVYILVVLSASSLIFESREL